MTAMRALGATAFAALVVLATACGDVYADPGGEQIPIPRTDAMAVLPKDIPVQCAATRPNENAPCQFEGSTCEYGTSPDMQCNKTYACTPDVSGSFWLERSVDRCVKSLCPATPADIESIDGQPCTIPPTNDGGAPSDADEAVCSMTNGICACTTGPDAAHAHDRHWVCIKPSAGGCPTQRPRAGEGCAGNLWCDYGSCKWKRGLLMQCIDNHWATGGAPCN